MGWGCYKHKVDAGSNPWENKMEELCDSKLSKCPLTWGRDLSICPFCYAELEFSWRRMEIALLKISNREHAETCAKELFAGDCDCHVAISKAEVTTNKEKT